MSDNNSMNSFLAAINSQKEVMRNVSILESSAAMAFRSMREPFNERQAMMGSIKGSRSVLGSLNELNYSDKVKLGIGSSAVVSAINSSIKKDIKGHQSALDSILGIHKESKKTLISGTMNPVSALKSATQILGEGWKQHQAAFGMFHEQTVKLTHIFNPAISDFIQKNVRTDFKKGASFSAIEEICLGSFGQIKDDFDAGTLQDIGAKIEATPKIWGKIVGLAETYCDERLYDVFLDKLSDIISEEFKIKKSYVRTFVMFIVAYLTLIKPNVDDYMQSKIDEGQNGKLVLHDSKMNSLEKKIEKLKSENSLEKHIKNSKRKFFIGLNSSVESFEKELLLKFKKTTVRKYTLIAAAFVNYIFVHTNCTAIEEVKQADISKFITSVRYDELNRFEVDEIRKKLNNYLEFLEREQGNNSKH